MYRSIVTRGLLPAVVMVLLGTAGPASAHAAVPLPPAVPAPSLANCAGVHALVPFARDGDYVLVTDHTILTVYCHDMAGTPREYVTLPNTGPDQNFSQYTAGLA
ncbi:MAG TPA: GON domain-containing protein, partial [Mycobacteriales bacterium]|nr:GON domain-containing protein [Mycobacteriales bacterium]